MTDAPLTRRHHSLGSIGLRTSAPSVTIDNVTTAGDLGPSLLRFFFFFFFFAVLRDRKKQEASSMSSSAAGTVRGRGGATKSGARLGSQSKEK